MRLKLTPAVNTRYWVAILIASTCGTNLGDLLPKLLGLSIVPGLLLCLGLFALLMLVERSLALGSELLYWVAILIVRTAATDIADALADKTPLHDAGAIALLAAVMLTLVAVHHRYADGARNDRMPDVDGMYWLTMLMAGALGTVLGDTIAHALGAHHTGLLPSELIASVVLVLILAVRTRLVGAWAYWAAIVAVRWWGTNMGDFFAHKYSLMGSGIVSLVSLFVLLIVWQRSEPPQLLEQA
jgi:uncharacterized membrane-anchored protein